MSNHPSMAGEDFDDPVDEYRQAARDAGQRACTCGSWHDDGESCPTGGEQIMATGSEGWDL